VIESEVYWYTMCLKKMEHFYFTITLAKAD